jgi:hypothetical protein
MRRRELSYVGRKVAQRLSPDGFLLPGCCFSNRKRGQKVLRPAIFSGRRKFVFYFNDLALQDRVAFLVPKSRTPLK